jgi:hypothetical protein
MSLTKGELVTAALGEFGISSYEFDITPEELASGVRRLNAMMAFWASKNLLLSYADSDDTDAESNIPGVALEAVITNLAIRLAPSYGKQVPLEVATVAKESLNALLSVSTKPRQQQFAVMPRGAGYKTTTYPFTTPPGEQYLVNVDESVDLSGGPDGA